MKYLHLDTETTGSDRAVCGIWQVAGIIEEDDKILEKFDVKMDPGPDVFIDEWVTKNFKITHESLSKYQPKKDAVAALTKIFKGHLDSADRRDKYFLVGYNVGFDNEFMRKLFTEFDSDFGRFIWTPPLDVMSLAGEFMKSIRKDMPNFKLITVYNVASMVGIVEKVSDEELLNASHDAMFDIELTRRLYKALSYDNVDKVTRVLRKINKPDGTPE